MNYLNLNPTSAQALKREYDKAVKTGAASFMFQNKEILTTYAKYIIEYLKNNKLL